jgi:hypothetical protein
MGSKTLGCWCDGAVIEPHNGRDGKGRVKQVTLLSVFRVRIVRNLEIRGREVLPELVDLNLGWGEGIEVLTATSRQTPNLILYEQGLQASSTGRGVRTFS